MLDLLSEFLNSNIFQFQTHLLQIFGEFKSLNYSYKNTPHVGMVVGPGNDLNNNTPNAVPVHEPGLQPRAVVRLLAEVFGEMVFCRGHVHCDPHPGAWG